MTRIRRISVTNLFRKFDHVIPLNMDDRITIIHSPNGFGKTIILRLLSELFGQESSTLRKIPFNEFRVDFDDDTSFWVDKALSPHHIQEEERLLPPKITFHATDHNFKERSQALKLFTASMQQTFIERGLSASMIEHLIPGLERVSANSWHYHPTGEILSMMDIVERFGERLPIERQPNEKESVWLKAMRSRIPIRFIETQRLLNPKKLRRSGEFERQPMMEPTVTSYSKELAEAIKTKLAESTALSQSLDRTFPMRVVSPTSQQHSITEEEIRDKLTELEKKRAQLVAAGLLDQDDGGPVKVGDQIDKSTKVVLSVYVEDTEKKLGVFDEIANKIELLTKIIDKRFLYKRMTISREQGFIFTALDGARLSPTELSSGEQHELVLFYELLFKVARGSLILIDEPELSLHVVWQEQFLRDLQEAIGLADFDALIATHSPDIIDNRRDLMVELKGPQ